MAIVNSSGTITTSSQPSVLTRRTSAFGGVVNGSNINLGSAVYDTTSMYDGTTTFTAATAGKYLVYFAALFINISGATQVGIAIHRSNGDHYLYYGSLSATNQGNANGSIVLNLSASETVTFWVLLNGGSADIQGKLISGNDYPTFFGMTLLG